MALMVLGAMRLVSASRQVLVTLLSLLVMLGEWPIDAQAQTPRPRLPTAALPPGAFAFAADPYSAPPYESEILLVRERSGVLRAWFIPVRQGARRLPQDERWTPGLACPRFVVDFEVGTLGCENPALPDEVMARYRWRLDGQRLTEFVPDLLAIPGREDKGFFVLHRSP
jgi:hypothetical protein